MLINLILCSFIFTIKEIVVLTAITYRDKMYTPAHDTIKS
jgi:hypothetical protein